MCTDAQKFIFIDDIQAALKAAEWEDVAEEQAADVRDAALTLADQLAFEAEGELIVVRSENEARWAELEHDLDRSDTNYFFQMVWDHLGGMFPRGVPPWYEKYNRTGRVRVVERLTAARTWETESGQQLTAQPGDVLLTDGSSTWSITADEFAASYRMCGTQE